MFRTSFLKWFTPVLLAGALLAAAQPAAAQGVLDRIKRAAEEAAKKAEEAKKAADAKKAAEEAAKKGATPAVPGGGNPNANSPNAATPAQPGRGGNAGPSNVPPSSAKVEEFVLAAGAGQKLNFVVGPKGGHAAAVVLRGSRTVVVHDGVDGPRFDAIVGDSAGLIFSPDGSRLAYVARQGAEFVFMVDGKELLRLPGATHPQITWNPPQSSVPQFTDNSRHVYFPLYTQPDPSITNGYYQLVVDGVAGPQSFTMMTPIFGAGGDHHVYMVESPQKRGTFTVVVDGKPSPIPGGEPQMTADGLHVLTKRVVPGAGVEVLLDGKPIMKAQSAQIYTTPVGAGFMTVVSQGGPGTGINFLTMGTQRIPGTDCPANPGYVGLTFSPDAKHWAAACQASASSYWIVADGKKGQEYQGLQPAGFTADGRFVYGASMRNQTFLVTGDQETDGYTSILPASDPLVQPFAKPILSGIVSVGPPAAIVGNHIGFTAQTSSVNSMSAVVIDGKALQRDSASRVIFSADGSRFGFTFGRAQSKTVNIDGKDMPGSAIPFQTPGNGRNRPRAEFVFSPDGKRFAYFDTRPDNRSGINVDGKFVLEFPGTQPENLTFTPDSRHLIWLANAFGGGHVIFVDGRQALRVDSNYMIQNAAGAWEMGADGTLTMVAQSGDAIKRFRITPGADTSVDTIGK